MEYASPLDVLRANVKPNIHVELSDRESQESPNKESNDHENSKYTQFVKKHILDTNSRLEQVVPNMVKLQGE